MKTASLSALAAAAVIATAQAQTGTPVPKLAAFDSAMLALLAQHKVPGGQLAISRMGRIIYSRGFGRADSAAGRDVQPHSLFRLASLSKPITSIAVFRLIQDGKLALGDKVFGTGGILDDTLYAGIRDPRVRDITVKHLLEHGGGWNRDAAGDYVFMSQLVAREMKSALPPDAITVIRWALKHRDLDFAPGTQYQYSNLGYSILGRVIEKRTGRGYEAWVRDAILKPLGITAMRTGFNLAKDRLPDEVAYYQYPGSGNGLSVYDTTTIVPWAYGGFNLEAFDSFGGWVASAQDLCRLLLAVDGFPTVPDILSSASIAAMTQASATNPYHARGWYVNSVPNWWHFGSLSGLTTELVRGANQMNWALFVNTRPANTAPLETAMDNLVWGVIPKIASWPDSEVVVSAGPIARAQPRRGGVHRAAGGLVRIPAEGGALPEAFTLADVAGGSVRVTGSREGAEWVLDCRALPKGIRFLRVERRIETLLIQ